MQYIYKNNEVFNFSFFSEKKTLMDVIYIKIKLNVFIYLFILTNWNVEKLYTSASNFSDSTFCL